MTHDHGASSNGPGKSGGNRHSPRSERPDGRDLDDFGVRLTKAREELKAKTAEPETKRAGAMGIAFRLSTEMVLALVIGGGIGWFIDDWLGTIPLFLLIFFVIGIAAGVKNVIRAANELNRENGAVGDSEDSGSEDTPKSK